MDSESDPVVRAWVDSFLSFSLAQQRGALRLLMSSIAVSLVCFVQTLLPRVFKRDILSLLPLPVSCSIFFRLGVADLGRAAMVSKTWRERVYTDTMWKEQCLERWPHYVATNARNLTDLWRSLYSSRHIVDENWQEVPFSSSKLVDTADRRCVKFDSEKIVTGGFRSVYVTDAKSGERIKEFPNCHGNWVWSLTYDDERDHLITGSWDETMKIASLETGKVIQEFQGHQGGVWGMTVDYEAGTIYSSSNDKTIKSWDMELGKCVWTLEGHSAGVYAVQRHDSLLVSAGGDHEARVWDLRTLQVARVLKDHSDVVSCLHYNGMKLVTGSHDGTIKRWDVGTGRAVLTCVGHEDNVNCVQFDDSKIVSGSDDCTARIWDARFGSCQQVLRGHEHEVKCLQYDEDKIMTSGRDKFIMMWWPPARSPGLDLPEDASNIVMPAEETGPSEESEEAEVVAATPAWD